MSLNFRYLGEQNTKLWTKDDWATYNSLIWGTMATSISFLCEETADEFIRRANLLRIYNEEIKKENIVKFYGLSTNAETRTSHQWAVIHFANRNKCGNAWKNKVYSLQLKAEEKEYQLKS